jgi:hypothetical protein
MGIGTYLKKKLFFRLEKTTLLRYIYSMHRGGFSLAEQQKVLLTEVAENTGSTLLQF